jgi:hypothetical protein
MRCLATQSCATRSDAPSQFVFHLSSSSCVRSFRHFNLTRCSQTDVCYFPGFKGECFVLTQMNSRYWGLATSLVFFGVGWDWVHLVRRPLIGLLYQPRMIDEYGAVCGMKIGRGNRSSRRKPAPVALCPPQISHHLTWDRTRRLTAWAMARPLLLPKFFVG